MPSLSTPLMQHNDEDLVKMHTMRRMQDIVQLFKRRKKSPTQILFLGQKFPWGFETQMKWNTNSSEPAPRQSSQKEMEERERDKNECREQETFDLVTA